MLHWIKDVIDLFIPHTCVSCDSNITEPAPGLCGRCIHKIQVLPRNCDHELTLRLRKHTNQVDSSMALMYFEQHGVSQHLLHKIKYKHGEHLARHWGRYLGERLRSTESWSDETFTMLIPVPMHKRRKRRRGYNAPLHIAYGIQEALGTNALVSPSALGRVKHNKSQTTADFNQRYQRLKGSYLANPMQNKPDAIILIDDVITSTSTISHCTEALRRVFRCPIYAVALAFTP